MSSKAKVSYSKMPDVVIIHIHAHEFAVLRRGRDAGVWFDIALATVSMAIGLLPSALQSDANPRYGYGVAVLITIAAVGGVHAFWQWHRGEFRKTVDEIESRIQD